MEIFFPIYPLSSNSFKCSYSRSGGRINTKEEKKIIACVLIYRQKYYISRKTQDIMVTADEHFQGTLDEFRRLARTKHTVDFDPALIRFSEVEIAYVRLLAFFLSSLLFFFFLRARARSAYDATKIIRARKE